MTTLLISHPAALEHATPPGHPERADRIRAVMAALDGSQFAALARQEAPLGSFNDAMSCHDNDYLIELEANLPSSGRAMFDADTSATPGSREAMLRGVGGAKLAVDAVMEGRFGNAFCAMRPPGHHAEHNKAMGFCFLNNAAIAARHAQRQHGAQRVAIVDWDVHHGNGTQDIFWNDPTVLFASTHEMPLYPGSGALSERGEAGTILNVPLKAGDDGAVFRDAFQSAVLPRVEAFAPDLIIISAGFDAHVRDPLANLRLVEGDFAWATLELMAIARRRCEGRIVSLLEGGYDLKGLAGSAAAHVEALMGA
jgi:acetoin utilization deacetylase AcuC-like enzyme